MDGMIKEIVVHNYRNELPDCMVWPASQPVEVGVMQSKGALLGNPYYREPRALSIEKFRQYLIAQVQASKHNGPIYQELLRLARLYEKGEQIVLTCCCAPKPCHADILKKAIIWLAATELGC